MYIDTHTHYDHYRFGKDYPEVLERIRKDGVKYILNPAIDFSTNAKMYEKLRSYPWIYFAAGIHPSFVGEWDDALDAVWLSGLRECLAHLSRFIAVGELGMDYHHKPAEIVHERQSFWFRRQLALAQEFHKPLILHIREADADGIAILRDYSLLESGVVHCYNSDWNTAQQYLEMGLYFGIGGSVTLPDAQVLREAVKQIPLKKIILETDAPFVKPYGWTESLNNSLCIPQVAECIAQIKGITAEEVLSRTMENAETLFSFVENTD